jgi:hypothetical protein
VQGDRDEDLALTVAQLSYRGREHLKLLAVFEALAGARRQPV